ncbi:MAG: NuA4 histone acetyltransferase subunit [Alyxoria varia]|nr:MAG: NuA4 histone acetyltransferase subunit [Alyxoria varia]
MSVPPPAVEYGAGTQLHSAQNTRQRQYEADSHTKDEIAAIVLDPGYSVTRAGFAGEDTPKSVLPSYYGHLQDGSTVFDDSAVHNPTPGMEIRNHMNTDSTVNDWDIAEKLWYYSITSRLTGRKQTSPLRNGLNDPPPQGEDQEMEDAEEQENPLAETPLLMTEPGWNPPKNREKTIEIALEKWGAPAFWLGREGVLAAFSSGKPSSLVIDLGASSTSVTPVHDGLMLKKGTLRSPLAGNWVSDQLRMIFSQSNPQVNITPHYMISSKTPVDAGTPAQATYRSFANPPHESFYRLQQERVLTEFKETCVQVWNPHKQGSSLAQNVEHIKTQDQGRPFEFPDGWNNVFSVDRYRAVEGLFDENAAITDDKNPAPKAEHTIPKLAKTALDAIDTDIKPHCLYNVVVTGGSSLFYGLNDRVFSEVQAMYQGSRIRLHSPGNLVERKYASWVGGSILASLGTFHQMWISKKEYEEQGSMIVEKRCK